MARLLLCNPYYLKDDAVTRQAMDIYPLLGHGYLASHLEAQGHEVAIFDATFEKDARPYVDALEAIKPDVVGIYGHVLSRNNAFEYARIAQERGVKVLAGGPDATGYYDDYLGNGFDVVVRSEGEETASEVLAWHTAGGALEELQGIAGIAYKDEAGDVRLNPERPFIGDLDALRLPRRDEHIYRPYLDAWQQAHGKTSLHVIGARGCPFDCAFCYRPVFGRYYRRRSPENIVDELEQLIERFDTHHFRFVDDTFVVHRQWVHELAALIHERTPGVRFEVLSRSDLMTDELAEDLADMSVERVYFGMESGSDAVLEHMHKGVHAEQSIRAGEIVRRHGMEFLSWIMLGYPGEEKEDILKTRDMLVQVQPDVLSISVAFPIRHTPFYDEVKGTISAKRSLWRRTGENRLVFSGRYPALFYSFAQRWLHKEVQLARGVRSPLLKPLYVALKAGYRAGMELLSLRRPRGSAKRGRPHIEEGDVINVVDGSGS